MCRNVFANWMIKVNNKLIKLAVSAVLATAIVGCGEKSSSEYVESANTALKTNDYKTAIIELKNAIKQEPEQAEARFLLGETYLKLRQYDFAEKELERALEFGYSPEKVIPLLSKTYQKNGANKSLFKLTSKAKGLKPIDLAQLKFFQIQAYVTAGNDTKAQSLIDELKGISGGGPFAKLAFVYDLILKNQLDGAVTQLDQILATYKNQQDALKIKANIQLRLQQGEAAAETYAQYIEAYPDEAEVKYVLAQLYSDLGQPQNAEPLVTELLKNYPKQPVLLQIKSTALLQKKDYAGAFEYAEKSLAINPEDTATRLIAGVSSYLNKNFEKSESHLSLVASLLPANHPALRMLADSQIRLGRALDANETVQMFDNISERDSGLMSGLGQALLKDGEIKKAKEVLNKQPDTLNSPYALAGQATLKLSLNDVSGIVDLEQALAKMEATQTPLATEQLELTLVQAYMSTKQYDKALEVAQAWQKDSELAVKGWMLAAKVHAIQGNTVEAQNALQQGLKIEPTNTVIQFQLIELLPTKTEQERLEMLAKLNQLLKDAPSFLPAVSKHYVLTKVLKQPETMTAHVKQLISENDSNAILHITLGRLYTAEGKFDQALASFEKAKTINSSPAPYWELLANAFIQTKNIDGAKNLYQQWFDAQPNNPKAIIGMMKLYDSTGELNKAIELADHYSNEVGGKDFEIIALHAYALARAGKYPSAKIKIAELPQQIQALPFVKGTTGLIQLSEGDLGNAVSNLSLAYKANPSPMNANWMINAIARHQGIDAAIAATKQHIQSLPTDELNILRYAQMQTSRDEPEAKLYYQKALELNPKNFVAHNNLAYLYSESKDYKLALSHAQKALEMRPNDGRVLDTIGAIELKLGNYEEALKHLAAAVTDKNTQSTDDVFVNYVEALYANKEFKLAERKISQYTFKKSTTQAQLEKVKIKYL